MVRVLGKGEVVSSILTGSTRISGASFPSQFGVEGVAQNSTSSVRREVRCFEREIST